MIAYADTGFLISLYGQDANSIAADALITDRPVFLMTSFGEVEFTNALELRVFRKDWSRQEARAIREQFYEHQAWGIFREADLGPKVWEQALSLSRRYSAKAGTRTLDLIHVAIAVVLKPEAFFTFDKRQRRVAMAEHLRVFPALKSVETR